MGLAVAVMLYALARHRFGAPAWLATLAAVPVLYDGFEIQLEHLILSDVPFLFLLMLATTLLLWDPPGRRLRTCAVIGLLLGSRRSLRSVGLPLLARVRRVHDHQAVQLAEGRGHHRGNRIVGLNDTLVGRKFAGRLRLRSLEFGVDEFSIAAQPDESAGAPRDLRLAGPGLYGFCGRLQRLRPNARARTGVVDLEADQRNAAAPDLTLPLTT